MSHFFCFEREWIVIGLHPFCRVNKVDFKTLLSTLPQFRSIIPCEVLLYIEVAFLGFIH